MFSPERYPCSRRKIPFSDSFSPQKEADYRGGRREGKFFAKSGQRPNSLNFPGGKLRTQFRTSIDAWFFAYFLRDISNIHHTRIWTVAQEFSSLVGFFCISVKRGKILPLSPLDLNPLIIFLRRRERREGKRPHLNWEKDISRNGVSSIENMKLRFKIYFYSFYLSNM